LRKLSSRIVRGRVVDNENLEAVSLLERKQGIDTALEGRCSVSSADGDRERRQWDIRLRQRELIANRFLDNFRFQLIADPNAYLLREPPHLADVFSH
jgi:hypothetical protein